MNDLRLLKGNPIEVEQNILVHPLTLGEITDIGEQTYNSYVSALMINKSLLDNLSSEQISEEALNQLYKCNDLDFIIYLSMNDNNILYTFIESLKAFLKCDVQIKENVGLMLVVNDKEILLTDELFNKIKKIVIKQNYLKDNEQSKFKPANAKARALLEKLNKAKEKIQNQNKDEGLSLKDIVSIVATYSNDINIKSVWDLTVYQLYICYLRLIVWDDYHNKFQLIPHSSGVDSLDLKHWAIDINKIN